MPRLTAILLTGLTFAMSGCAMVEVGVRNPIPGLERVAVVPFFNLSQDRSVDGREFALAYYSELQKIPGFEVLTVGVTERAMFDHGLTMSGPQDALSLAKILDVDAVVIGAITDFDAYHPRIGLKVSWYSPQQWLVLPNAPEKHAGLMARPAHGLVVRAQSSDSHVIPDEIWVAQNEATDAGWSASPPRSPIIAAQLSTPEPERFQPPVTLEQLTPAQTQPAQTQPRQTPPSFSGPAAEHSEPESVSEQPSPWHCRGMPLRVIRNEIPRQVMHRRSQASHRNSMQQ